MKSLPFALPLACRRELAGEGVLPAIRDDALFGISTEVTDFASSVSRWRPPNSGIQPSGGTCNLPDTLSGNRATTLAGLISSSMNASIAAL